MVLSKVYSGVTNTSNNTNNNKPNKEGHTTNPTATLGSGSIHEQQQNEKGGNEEQQQLAIGFGNNYYWAIASPCEVIPSSTGFSDSMTKATKTTIYEWPTINSPPWKNALKRFNTRGNSTTTMIAGSKQRDQQVTTSAAKSSRNNDNNSGDDNSIIEQVVCSGQATIFLTKQGTIYQQGTMYGMVLPEPVPIVLPVSIRQQNKKVIQIAAGKHFAIGLLENGFGVFTWGAGHYGQLGIGSNNNYVDGDDELSTTGSKNKNMDQGDDSDIENNDQIGTTIPRRRSGTSTSNNDSYERRTCQITGQLLFTSKPVMIEKLSPNSSNSNNDVMEPSPVIAISAGDYHALALTKSGRVYAWGCNRYMQCGHDPTLNKCNSVQSYPTLNTVSSLDMQESYDDGDDNNRKDDVARMKYSRTISTPTIMSPTLVPLPFLVSQIAAGRSHSVAVSFDMKQVVCWGNNQYGQCGKNPSMQQMTVASSSISCNRCPCIKPTQAVKELEGVEIIQIAAGGNHTLALTRSGHVVTWGNHSDGQSGILGSSTLGSITQFKPRWISELDFNGSGGAMPGLCNMNHNNYRKKLNITPPGSPTSSAMDFIMSSASSSPRFKNNILHPGVTMSSPSVLLPQIISIVAGDSYSAAITCSGDVYVWGSNDIGQLGIPTPSNDTEIPFIREGGRIPYLKESPIHQEQRRADGMVGYEGMLAIGSPPVGLPPQSSFASQGNRKKGLVSTKKLVRNVRTFDSDHNVLLPTRLDRVKHMKVQQIACGPNHMWIVGESRRENNCANTNKKSK